MRVEWLFWHIMFVSRILILDRYCRRIWFLTHACAVIAIWCIITRFGCARRKCGHADPVCSAYLWDEMFVRNLCLFVRNLWDDSSNLSWYRFLIPTGKLNCVVVNLPGQVRSVLLPFFATFPKLSIWWDEKKNMDTILLWRSVPAVVRTEGASFLWC